MSALGNITTVSLREEAARAIRTGIMTGEIRPGELYSVPVLSARLGVSATPVREAMLDLVGEGLVESVRNRGYKVVSLSPADLDAILKIRLMLEVPGMGDVAEFHRAEDLQPFRTVVDRLPKTARKGDFQAYLKGDQDFHLGLLRLGGNPRLVDIVMVLRNQTRLFDVGKLIAKGELEETGAEHAEILETIAKRDRRKTEALMKEHLLRLRRAWTPES